MWLGVFVYLVFGILDDVFVLTELQKVASMASMLVLFFSQTVLILGL